MGADFNTKCNYCEILGTYAQLHIDIMLRRLAGRYYNEFFYPCVILSFMAIISMVAIEPIVSVGIHVVIVSKLSGLQGNRAFV